MAKTLAIFISVYYLTTVLTQLITSQLKGSSEDDIVIALLSPILLFFMFGWPILGGIVVLALLLQLLGPYLHQTPRQMVFVEIGLLVLVCIFAGGIEPIMILIPGQWILSRLIYLWLERPTVADAQ